MDYFAELQDDITESMRAILVDWLVSVHEKFRLRDETLFITVNMIDRFLTKRVISRRHLQLVGVACMFIASKYEEIHPPLVQDFELVADHVEQLVT